MRLAVEGRPAGRLVSHRRRARRKRLMLILCLCAVLYTENTSGLKVDPVVVLVLAIGFIFSVVALHGTFFSPFRSFIL